MKKAICIILIFVMSFALCACGVNKANVDEKGMNSAPEVSPVPISTPTPALETAASPATDTASANGYTVRIVSVHKTADSNGEPLAAVELLFKNDNSTPVSFMGCAQVKGFQNGIQLFKEEMFLERDYDWDSYYTEIKDGAEISVFRPLPLQNAEDPVEITVDIIDMMNGKFLATASTTMDLTD